MEQLTANLILFALAGAVYAFLRWRKYLQVKAWTAWAAAHGFTTVGGWQFHPPDLSGNRRGVPVEVVVETRRGRKDRRVVSVVRATIPAPMPRGLYIRREFSEDGVAKLKRGEQDIQIDDPWIDRNVLIQADAPAEAVRGILTAPAVRDALREFVNLGAQYTFFVGPRSVRIENGAAVLELNSIAIERVAAAIRVSAEAARALAVAAGASEDALRGPAERGSLDASLDPSGTAPVSGATGSGAAAEPEPSPVEGGSGTDSGPGSPVPATAHAPGPPRPDAAAPITDAPPTAPPPPSPPEPAAPAAAASPHWQGIQAFRERRVPIGEREPALRALAAAPLAGVLTVERVDWTSGLRIEPRLDGGRTVIGSLDALPGSVALRCPAADNAAADALVRGARIDVRVRIILWDELFERTVLELDPSVPSPLVAPGR